MTMISIPSFGPIKILHLVDHFGAGGAEKVLVHLCNSKNPRIKNIICSFKEPCPAFQLQIDEAKRDIRWVHKKPGNDWGVVRKIREIIDTERVDIVHAQGWGVYMEGLLAAKRIPFFRGPPFIFAFRGKTISELDRGIPFHRRLAQRIAYYRTDALVAPAKNMAKDYAQSIGIQVEAFDIIFNGINTYEFAQPYPGARARLGIDDDDFVVGFVGRLDAVKDPAGLIEVFSRFLKLAGDTNRRPVLLIIGQGEEMEPLMGLAAARGFKDRVLMPGLRSDIPACMSAMDAYLQPSLYEGHSNTILEAMASGLPVISTRVGGTPEIIEHGQTGFLFAPRDYEGMTGALLNLYQDMDLAKRVGDAGRETVLRRFSADEMVRNYEKLYERLLAKRGGKVVGISCAE